MADVVQYRLERMVNELDDLEQRGLFTRREIAEIVKQRRKFEYRLKRPSPLKQDFLAYIEYETQLDSLRRLRKKSAARETKKKMKKSVSDYAGVARIIEIYRMAVTRYKGDVDLWFKYLEFCRQRKNGRMKKALAQVIRFHPKVPGVWIYAAAWEFDHNLNVAAARALMQSGLRLCPKSEDLWVEYLRMELTYLNKLKARRVALGEDEGTLTRDQKDADEKQWRDENQDLFMSLNEERDVSKGSDAEKEESEKKSDLFREQGLNILQIIYISALEALPSNFNLRKRLFEILEGTDLADSEEMREKIFNDMKRDFSVDPEYWDWLARVGIPDLSNVEDLSEESMQHKLLKGAEVYEEALEVVPSAYLFTLYIKFLMDITFIKEGETQNAGLSGHTEKYVSRLLAVFEKAEAMGYLNEELACKYVSFYLQLERLAEARELAEKLCSGRLSNSVQLWQLRVSIEVRYATRNQSPPRKEDLYSIFELLRKILTDVPVSEAKSLWLMALDVFANHKHYLEKLVEIAFISLVNNGNEDGFSVSSAMVKFVLEKDGIEHARKIYKKFLTLPRPSLDIYQTSIELELNLASSGDKESLAKVRKLYEAALSIYDQNLSLWQDYYSMEIKMGTSETANAVQWKARRTLKDASAIAALTNCR